MTTEQILSEIKNIDVNSFEKGMTILDHFIKTNQQYPAESLLLHLADNSVKWYYNYTEKLLRRIEVNFKQANKTNEKNEQWFKAISDEDETSISFTAEQFADKVVIYDDWHKLVTYDEKTGHYECFFIDIPEDIAKAIREEENLTLYDSEIDQSVSIDELMEESAEFANACSTLSNWMLNNDVVSELRFSNVPEGIKLDLVQSMLFTGNQEDESDKLDAEPDSLD